MHWHPHIGFLGSPLKTHFWWSSLDSKTWYPPEIARIFTVSALLWDPSGLLFGFGRNSRFFRRIALGCVHLSEDSVITLTLASSYSRPGSQHSYCGTFRWSGICFRETSVLSRPFGDHWRQMPLQCRRWTAQRSQNAHRTAFRVARHIHPKQKVNMLSILLISLINLEKF